MAPSIFDTRLRFPKLMTCIGLSTSMPVNGVSIKPSFHSLCTEKSIYSAWNYDIRLHSFGITGFLRGRSFATFAPGHTSPPSKLSTVHSRTTCSTLTWLGLSGTSPIYNVQHFPASLPRNIFGGALTFSNGFQAVRHVHNSAGPCHRSEFSIDRIANLTAINATQSQSIPAQYEIFKTPHLQVHAPDNSDSPSHCGEVLCPLWAQYPDQYPLCQARCSGHEKDRIRWLRRHLEEQHSNHLSKEKLDNAVRMTRVNTPENRDLDRRKRRGSKLSNQDVFETIFLRVRQVLNGTPCDVAIQRCTMSSGHTGPHNGHQNDSAPRRSLSNRSERNRGLPSSSSPGSGTNSPTRLKYQVQSVQSSLEHLSNYAANNPSHARTIENFVAHIDLLVTKCKQETMFNIPPDNLEAASLFAQYSEPMPSPSRSAASGESRMPIPPLYLGDTQSGSITSVSYVPSGQTWQENFQRPSDVTRVEPQVPSVSSTGTNQMAHMFRNNQMAMSMFGETSIPFNSTPSNNDQRMSDPFVSLPNSQEDLQGLHCPRCNGVLGLCRCRISDQFRY